MIPHEHPQREAMQGYSLQFIAATYIHTDQFSMQILGRYTRKGHWQYRIGVNAGFQETRNTSFHGKGFSRTGTGHYTNSIVRGCGYLVCRRCRAKSIGPRHLALQSVAIGTIGKEGRYAESLGSKPFAVVVVTKGVEHCVVQRRKRAGNASTANVAQRSAALAKGEIRIRPFSVPAREGIQGLRATGQRFARVTDPESLHVLFLPLSSQSPAISGFGGGGGR